VATRKNTSEQFHMRGRNRRSRVIIIVMHYQMKCTKGVWRMWNNTMDEVGNHRLVNLMAIQDSDANVS
jgi:hypothetical protein